MGGVVVVVVVIVVVVVVVVVEGVVVVVDDGGGGTTVVLGGPSDPVTVMVSDVAGGPAGEGPVSTVVAVSVTGPLVPVPLVNVTARPLMANSTAAAAAPNKIVGRLYQGSGPGSGVKPSSSWLNSIGGRAAPVAAGSKV